MTFDDTLARWLRADRDRADARIAYERTYARALITADGKSSEVRKAQADLASLTELRAYEHATSEARALEHMVLHMRAPANENVGLHVPPHVSVTPDGELRL